MRGDTSSHGRRRSPASILQTRMWGAKIIDGTDQIHPLMQRHWPARQRPTSPCQRRETLAERSIEPFDVGGVDDAVTVRTTPERRDARGRACNDAPLHGDHAPLLVAFHDLGEEDMLPWPQPGAPLGAPPLRLATRLTNRPDIGAQPIGTDQQGTMQRAPTHPRDETTHQRQVPVGAHSSGEPPAGTDHPRQGHPDKAPLRLDADRVGLDLPQVPRLLDQRLMDRLPWDPSARQPTRYRPLLIAKCHDDRWQWTPVGHQGHHQADRLRRGPQAIPCRAFPRAERLVALRTHAALVLTRVDVNVTLACLSSGGARQIGAECGCGVHEASPLLALLGSMPRRSMSGPPFSLQLHLTTV